MKGRTMADAVRAVLIKRAFVPGDPAAGGAMPQDPAAAGGMPMDPAAAGGMPQDQAAAGGMPMDPAAAGGMPMDAMAGLPGVEAAAAPAQGGGMINMTADEFTSFIKKMLAAFQGGGAQVQQASQPDISAKLDTLIAVLQGKNGQAAAAPVAGV